MHIRIDALVIGAGPAGLAAAASLREQGVEKVVIIDREEHAGGVLLQCIHNGFGLHEFKEELTGPEYAERSLRRALESGATIDFSTAAVAMERTGERIITTTLAKGRGLVIYDSGVVILAMGCRERNRGNIGIPGSRPAGVMTAGLAQRLVNMDGYLPGKEVVILGSGDIGLIMARRMTWEGAKVKAVIELQSYPGGLARNIVQCLKDFHIPLYLSHTITDIRGEGRIREVEVAPVGPGYEPIRENSFTISCDTLLLSVGLVPENELSLDAGVTLHPVTGGPVVDHTYMTNIPGIFSCGNVLHVHDLVDFVSEESRLCGISAARFLAGERESASEIPVRAGNLVRYVLPMRVCPGEPVTLSLRPLTPAHQVTLSVTCGGSSILTKKFRIVEPSVMIRVPVDAVPESTEPLEVSLSVEEA